MTNLLGVVQDQAQSHGKGQGDIFIVVTHEKYYALLATPVVTPINMLLPQPFG